MNRLDELRAELVKVFGRMTRWQLLCKQQNATNEEDKIRLAEQVIAEPCTGTIAEARWYALELEGVKPKRSEHPYRPTGF